MSESGLAAAQDKMRSGGVHEAAIDVFSHYYHELESGATGIVAESDIDPLQQPTRLVDLDYDAAAGREALAATVVIKLNGGLGTSMGMSRAKSLLQVRDGLSFLDIIARQILHARQSLGVELPLLLMDSFRTRDDTLAALQAYPDLATEGLPLDFLQNREPKIAVDDLTPVEWAPDPSLEWCPPGHGDIYTALSASGLLRTLVERGFRYAFVSNADNLCATINAQAAAWFVDSGAPFASEVCRRTAADRKGGHLAIRKRDGQLILRESAQTAPEDLAALGDVTRHRYVTTNNLWIDLSALEAKLAERHGVLGLPLIRNEKTVDPSDKTSPAVVQIETAMGAAVEVFEGAQALEVERTRFLPVKSTNDLLALRSDVYRLGDDHGVHLADGREDAPNIDLDPDFYKLVGDFDARFPDGPPSMVEARSLTVHGDWTFEAGVVIRGEVSIDAEGSPGRISEDPPARDDG
jgi:UTP--glucose-1-phosphate uridylyltransferase